MKASVYMAPFSIIYHNYDLASSVFLQLDQEMLHRVLNELDYRADVCRSTQIHTSDICD